MCRTRRPSSSPDDCDVSLLAGFVETSPAAALAMLFARTPGMADTLAVGSDVDWDPAAGAAVPALDGIVEVVGALVLGALVGALRTRGDRMALMTCQSTGRIGARWSGEHARARVCV